MKKIEREEMQDIWDDFMDYMMYNPILTDAEKEFYGSYDYAESRMAEQELNDWENREQYGIDW